MKILSICGSPRKGNSEAVLFKIQKLLKQQGVENEIILLRKKRIKRCEGCVEYCNKELECQIQDDMKQIMKEMEEADTIIFISPNYFQMPTGLFKDFIDRCSIFYTKMCATGKNILKNKKAVVIGVGADNVANIDVCTDIIANNFCKGLEFNVVAKQSFKSKSELKGNHNSIFESNLNPDIQKDIEKLVEKLI